MSLSPLISCVPHKLDDPSNTPNQFSAILTAAIMASFALFFYFALKQIFLLLLKIQNVYILVRILTSSGTDEYLCIEQNKEPVNPNFRFGLVYKQKGL